MSKKGGHHGGSWKVAYADFVTAMMALFLLLWLTAQDHKIKEAVERAFRNPFLSLTKESAGIMPNRNQESASAGGGASKLENGSVSANEVAMLRKLQDDLTRLLNRQDREDEQEESVKFQLAPDGLRIHVFDRGRKPIFEANSCQLTEYGTWILTTLSWEIARYHSFMVELEGHTESGHVFPSPAYGGWELSADRANAARRKLLEHGVGGGQIRKVAGFADTLPLSGHMPVDPINRRITLLLRVNEGKSS